MSCDFLNAVISISSREKQSTCIKCSVEPDNKFVIINHLLTSRQKRLKFIQNSKHVEKKQSISGGLSGLSKVETGSERNGI